MEYRGIHLPSGRELFHFGPVHGTNNIGEFLAIVHALALLEKQGFHEMPVYSDSATAQIWVRKKKCGTKLQRTPQTAPLLDLVGRAELWLRTHEYRNPVIKWQTELWGEIPADFGRK